MMRYWRAIAAVSAVLCAGSFGANEPWRERYTGEQATGAQVIALWQFLPGQETEDASGNGHTLTLRGESRFVENGLFGSCLESFPSDEKGSERFGATARNQASLTPKGAFTLELWIRPKPELAQRSNAFLIDKKNFHYVSDRPTANQGYQLTLHNGGRQIRAFLGFGEDSEYFRSEPVELPVEEWSYIAFTYNGAGLGRFFLNGQPVGQVYHEGRGPIAHGRHLVTLGDRVGSMYQGFPGYIDQVRIMNDTPEWLAPKPFATLSDGRTVFQRMEQGAALTVSVNNALTETLQELRATVLMGGEPLGEKLHLPDLPGLQAARVKIPVDTSLKPDVYPLVVRFTGRIESDPVEFATEGALTVTPRPLPREFPVVMWGSADIETMKEIGFTHSLHWMADHGTVWSAGEPVIPYRTGERYANTLTSLDERLATGLKFIATVRPGKWVVDTGSKGHELRDSFRRVDRNGEPYDRTNVCGLFPEVQRFAYDVGVSIGQTFGHHPALDGAMIHTEVRDGSTLCFHDHDREAYRVRSGREIPEEAMGRGGIPGRRHEFVPVDGIVADDHPILDYYRWFWREGDGWNELHSQTHRGLKTGTHPRFWTFFDPAVRCPPIWGSGGEVDVLSQWTYTYPETPRIALATDELFAMAEGRSGQRVMKMTQIIWYRNQTAPNLPEREEDRVDWEKTEPEARFITISPDHLREAFWFKLSRPVQGIMYHGIGSLVGTAHSSYRYTNPETRVALAELVRNVAVPLGPTLMQIPDPEVDVAMLESFTSSVFGARATWGWGRGWVADMHQLLQWARFQPKVLYEEAILRDGLEGIRVLVLPNCPALPQSVFERIAEFQRRGGIVVADQHLAPALVPDILIREPDRENEPHLNKAMLQALAGQLREELAPVYAWRADSSDPDIIVRLRQHGDTEYFFAINDKRTYGDYVGHHRRVMEKGLPNQATLTIKRPGATVYDLLTHQAVQTRDSAGGIEWDADFGPGEGRLYMISPSPVHSVQVTVARRRPASPGVNVNVRVMAGRWRRLPAVVPVHVDVVDPAGSTAEFSGYYGASDGAISLQLDLATNDAAGTWTVRARELASGKTAETRFEYHR